MNIQQLKPITRYWNYGVTFRWTQGDSYVVVKQGYVIEGKSVIIRRERPEEIKDLPHQSPWNDKEHWYHTFPVSPSQWHDGCALKQLADKWAHNNPTLVNLRDHLEPRDSRR